VSAEEWEGIPDVGDRTIKKRPRFMAVAAAPDSLLSKAAAASQMDASISVDGLQTPAGAATNADLTAIGKQIVAFVSHSAPATCSVPLQLLDIVQLVALTYRLSLCGGRVGIQTYVHAVLLSKAAAASQMDPSVWTGCRRQQALQPTLTSPPLVSSSKKSQPAQLLQAYMVYVRVLAGVCSSRRSGAAMMYHHLPPAAHVHACYMSSAARFPDMLCAAAAATAAAAAR
jgi:hypothetical protein